MLSTPINIKFLPSYFHNPEGSFIYIKALTPKERDVYIAGSIQAFYQVIEAMGDAKRVYLSALLKGDMVEENKLLFEKQVKFLDNFENVLKKRISHLEGTLSTNDS